MIREGLRRNGFWLKLRKFIVYHLQRALNLTFTDVDKRDCRRRKKNINTPVRIMAKCEGRKKE